MTKKSAVAQVQAGDPIAQARAEVERLNAQELRFATLYREGSAALAGIRSKRGRQVLDANDPSGAAGAINQRIRAVEDELAAMAEAAAEARRARLLAIAAFIAAESDAKERRAEQLNADAAKLEAESSRLREALERHGDWGYVPAEGKVDGRYVPAVQQGAGGFRVIDARGPRHARLRAEAQGLRTQAAQGRFRQPHQAGSVEADNLEALLAAVYADPMRIGPPADAVAAWSEQARETEQRRRSRGVPTASTLVAADFPMYLEWRNGVLDAAQSRILAPAVGVIRVPAESPETIAKLGSLSDVPTNADPYQLAAVQVEDA